MSSGSDAITALQDQFYDLVITDYIMPGIGSVEVLKATKIIAPLTKVIIITGSTLGKEAILIGADDFLEKPFDLEELLVSIRLCLDKRTLQN